MNTTVQKWGNSLAVRIPQAVARQIGIEDGDTIQMAVEANALVLRPARPIYRLGDLVRRIRPSNRHDETGWGTAAGKEVW
jgi:antitoxin MazE